VTSPPVRGFKAILMRRMKGVVPKLLKHIVERKLLDKLTMIEAFQFFLND